MKLVHGSGSPTTGACWMSAINWYAHPEEAWSDQPDCVDPVIRTLAISLNDALPNNAERERVIGPHLFAPLGTWMGPELSLRRAYRVADWAVREIAPKAMRAAKLDAEAVKLETLAPVVDKGTARAAETAARAAALGIEPLLDRSERLAAARTAEAAAEASAIGEEWTARAAAVWAAEAIRRVAAGGEYQQALSLILELCEMGREEPKTCRTKQETLTRLEVGRFTE